MSESNTQNQDELVTMQLVEQCQAIGKFIPVIITKEGESIKGIAWRSPNSWKVIKLAVKREGKYLLFTANHHRKTNKFRGGELFSPSNELESAFEMIDQ